MIEPPQRPEAPTWARIVAATIVAVGLAAVWGFVCGFVADRSGGYVPGALEESIAITIDGEPLVASRLESDVTYRTPDGEAFQPKRNGLLSGNYLSAKRRERRSLDPPIAWRKRLAGMNSMSRPAAAWYLVRDAENDGSGCFEVFDRRSRRTIGFYGREGMRPTEPPADEWFDLGPERVGSLWSCVTSASNLSQGYYVWDQGVADDRQETVPPWTMYLLDRGEVIEIDARERSHRSVAEAPGAFELGIGTVPRTVMLPGGRVPPAGAVFAPVDTFDVAVAVAAPVVAAPNLAWEPAPDRRLFVRDADSVRVLNPKGGEEWRYALPEDLRGKSFTAFAVGPDDLRLQVFRRHWESGSVSELLAINAAGEVQDAREFELRGYTPPSEAAMAAGFATGVPSPLVGAVALVYQPWAAWYFADKPFGAELARVAAAAVPGWSIVVALALALAALTVVAHRREHRDHPAAWAVLVALVGPAAYLAYRVHWGRPPRVRCNECGAEVPRDREVCPACGAEWETPAPTGIEVWDPAA
ncbi:MAG: hypothetical protein AAF805_07880 [Planctomycetota bacterium]